LQIFGGDTVGWPSVHRFYGGLKPILQVSVTDLPTDACKIQKFFASFFQKRRPFFNAPEGDEADPLPLHQNI
jgi:hypothetical protein